MSFFGGAGFFFCFFGLAPCPTPSFYYQNNLFTALFISEPSGIREGGGGQGQKKKKKACLFLEGLDFFFFCFFGLAPCPAPSFYYQTNLFTALFISEPSGIREGGGQGQKKNKWHAFF